MGKLGQIHDLSATDANEEERSVKDMKWNKSLF